jgi:biotin carboxyl carrier protein
MTTFEIAGKQWLASDLLASPLPLTQESERSWLVPGEDGALVRVSIVKVEGHTLTLEVGGKRTVCKIETRADQLAKLIHLDRRQAQGPGELLAPMPGMVRGVRVAKGQVVAKGDALLVLEAMKMENVLKASAGGTIDEVLVAEGEAVEKGQPLLRFQ